MPMPNKTSSMRQEEEEELREVSAFRKKFEEAKSQDPSHGSPGPILNQNPEEDSEKLDLSANQSEKNSN